MKSYLIQQKIRPLVNQYDVFEAAADGQPGNLVGFAQQKRFAFKEKFMVYTDETKQTTAFEIQARQVLDLGARYDVRDASGTSLGTIGKVFGSSLLRSTWHIFAPDREDAPLMVVQEHSPGLAIFRRIWEFLPYIGDIPFFVKYNFDFINPASQQVVATYTKTTTFRDHYRLDIQDDMAEQADPRLLIALGIMLDALQSR
jgi:uncharacterized protein YxjI